MSQSKTIPLLDAAHELRTARCISHLAAISEVTDMLTTEKLPPAFALVDGGTLREIEPRGWWRGLGDYPRSSAFSLMIDGEPRLIPASEISLDRAAWRDALEIILSTAAEQRAKAVEARAKAEIESPDWSLGNVLSWIALRDPALIFHLDGRRDLQRHRRHYKGSDPPPFIKDGEKADAALLAGDLATMTKNSPARASGACISVIGHITAAELRECLDRTDMANGFGNRFLFACVRRSKFLPFGGHLREEDVTGMAGKVRRAVAQAQGVQRVIMSPAAAEGWATIYRDLSADRPGLLGSLTARAEAQVVRLATIYALWAGTQHIELEHLTAAVAVQEFCHKSVEYIFGDTLGDQAADTILAALKTAGRLGLTRTEISNLFSRNLLANQVARALGELSRRGIATQRKGEAVNGRAPEIWTAASHKEMPA
jgi:hypothetical protein